VLGSLIVAGGAAYVLGLAHPPRPLNVTHQKVALAKGHSYA